MDNKLSRGSEWRKWDLHLHSPFTCLHNNYKHNSKGVVGNDKFISDFDKDPDTLIDTIFSRKKFKFQS